MDVKTLCKMFCIKCTKEIQENTKVNQLVNYINKNQNHFEFSDVGESIISQQAFLKFMDNINSMENAALILSKYKNLAAVGFYPEEVANFYNVYSPEKFDFPGVKVAQMLLDTDYLKMASIEWTREHILEFSFDKVLEIKDGKIKVKNNILTQENEDEYMPGTDKNIEALNTAKKNNMLKQAIESLS